MSRAVFRRPEPGQEGRIEEYMFAVCSYGTQVSPRQSEGIGAWFLGGTSQEERQKKDREKNSRSLICPLFEWVSHMLCFSVYKKSKVLICW